MVRNNDLKGGMADKPPFIGDRYRYFCGWAGLAVPLDGVVLVPLGMLAAEVDSNDWADFTKDCGFSCSSSFTCGLAFRYVCNAGWFSRYSSLAASEGFFDSSPEMLP